MIAAGHSTGPGSLAGRGGRVPGRGTMGRGRQLPPSKYSVSKPVAGRGPGSVAAAAVSVAAVGATAPSSSSSLSAKLASASAGAGAGGIVRGKDGRIIPSAALSKPVTAIGNSNSSSSSISTTGNEIDGAAHDKDVRTSAGTSAESANTSVDRSGSISSTVLDSQSSTDNTVSVDPANVKIEGTGNASTVSSGGVVGDADADNSIKNHRIP